MERYIEIPIDRPKEESILDTITFRSEIIGDQVMQFYENDIFLQNLEKYIDSETDLFNSCEKCDIDLYRTINHEEASNTFDVFDLDNDGYINTSDIKYALENISNQIDELEIDEFFEEADVDGDGKLHHAEFIKFVCGRNDKQIKKSISPD